MREVIVKAAAAIRRYPLYFLALQIPQQLIDSLEYLLPHWMEKNPMTALVTLFPLYCVAVSITSALTFIGVRAVQAGEAPALSAALASTSQILTSLIVTALLVGALSLLGILAFIVPGIYLMATYLFVPWLIVESPGHPYGVYLSRSKNLTKPRIVPLMWTLAILIGIGFGMTYVDEIGKGFALMVREEWPWAPFAALVGRILIFMPFGALIDLGLSYYFLKLREGAP